MTTGSPKRRTRPVPQYRAVRVARGLSLREVARRAEIDPTHLSKVERGLEGLSVDTLGRLARVLGLNDLAGAIAAHVPAREDR